MGNGQSARERLAAEWGVETCMGCGEPILLGERVTRVGDHHHVLCSVCSSWPSDVRQREERQPSDYAEAAQREELQRSDYAEAA
jgi:hypothetical protein